MESISKKSATKRTARLTGWAIRLGPIMTVLFVFSSVASAQVTMPPPQKGWTITDLGVVSTIRGEATGETDSAATAINASGTVVGFSGVYITDAEEEGFVGFLNHDGFIWTPNSPNGTTGNLRYIGGLNGVYCYVPENTVAGLTTPGGYVQFDSVP